MEAFAIRSSKYKRRTRSTQVSMLFFFKAIIQCSLACCNHLHKKQAISTCDILLHCSECSVTLLTNSSCMSHQNDAKHFKVWYKHKAKAAGAVFFFGGGRKKSIALQLLEQGTIGKP